MAMKIRYSEFYDRINVDAFEEAIGFSPQIQDANGNDIGQCPDIWGMHSHGDTTGKFAIHRDKRVYNCWVCGGGSFLSLVMELYSMEPDEAAEWLYQFATEDMRTDSEFVEEFLAAFEDIEKRVETLPYFNEKVLLQYSDPLPEEWLVERGISHEVATLYGVRYSAQALRRSPPKGKFADEEDYHGPAIIFPHYWKSVLVGWQARWLDEDRPDWVPKYTMTGDFPKESTLYGWDLLNRHIMPPPIIVVESIPTTLYLETWGYAATATFGSSVNDPQLRLLRRLQSGVLLAPDNDPAGRKWLNTVSNYLKKYIPVWHLPPVEGEKSDLGDLPLEMLEEHLDKAYEPQIGFDG